MEVSLYIVVRVSVLIEVAIYSKKCVNAISTHLILFDESNFFFCTRHGMTDIRKRLAVREIAKAMPSLTSTHENLLGPGVKQPPTYAIVRCEFNWRISIEQLVSTMTTEL